MQNLDAQRVFLNSFENSVNRRVDIPEDIRRFQKTLQYARSKIDYTVAEYVYLLPSDMRLKATITKYWSQSLALILEQI